MASSKYHIINSRTGAIAGRANTLKGARSSLDRHDNKYGAYVHRIIEVKTGIKRY